MEADLLSKYWFLYSILAIIGIGVGIFSYRRSFPPLGKITRILLAVIRGIVIVILGLFLIEPVIDIQSTRSIEPGLDVLIDDSGSMEIADGGRSRIDIADSLRLAVLADMQVKAQSFLFSDSLQRMEDGGRVLNAGGDATSISGALEDIGSAAGFEETGAVLLITDGRQNLGEDPVSAAMKLNIPVYTLTVGKAVEERNISVDEVSSPAVVYSGDEFTLKAHVRATGIEVPTSTIFLKLDGKTIADRKFQIPGEGRMTEVEMNMTAPDPGEYEYTVSIPALDGEIESADNERSFVVRVLKSKVRILLGTSSLDWEYAFLKQALSRYDDFEIEAVYPAGHGRFSSTVASGGQKGLAGYDVIILVNSSPSGIRLQVGDLKKAVDDGASLIYVAGADCLVDMQRFDDLLPLDLRRPELVGGEFFFDVPPAYRQHAAIQLDDNPELSVRLWNSLPPFDRAVSDASPTGDVLLEAGTRLSGGRSLPVLTVKQYGAGRVAAITGFPLWRSYFGSSRDESLAEAIPTFWGNLVRWMAETERTENFKVITDRKVYRLGEPVRMTARVYDEAGRPRNGALVTVSVSSDKKEMPEREAALTQSGDGTYTGTISSLPPGSYSFISLALSYGDTLGTVTGDFKIEKSSLEMLSRAPDYGLTRRISEATGGVAYTTDDFGNFANDLHLTTYVRESHARIQPFGTTFFLLIVLAGLAIEWGLRKRFKLP
jgi:hypothetical protein